MWVDRQKKKKRCVVSDFIYFHKTVARGMCTFFATLWCTPLLFLVLCWSQSPTTDKSAPKISVRFVSGDIPWLFFHSFWIVGHGGIHRSVNPAGATCFHRSSFHKALCIQTPLLRDPTTGGRRPACVPYYVWCTGFGGDDFRRGALTHPIQPPAKG